MLVLVQSELQKNWGCDTGFEPLLISYVSVSRLLFHNALSQFMH